MKLQKLFILIIVLVSIQICFGQKRIESILAGETNIVTCDNFKAQIDNFFSQNLSLNSDLSGYIIIYGSQTDSLINYKIEQLIKNFIDYRKFDKNRVIITHGKSEKALRIQFWIVPKDSLKPEFAEELWNYQLPAATKAFKFYDDYENTIGACDTNPFNFDELYSKILQNNQNLRGWLIIKEKSAPAFHKTKTILLNRLVKIYKIPRAKIKIVDVKSGNMTSAEYWLVPRRYQ